MLKSCDKSKLQVCNTGNYLEDFMTVKQKKPLLRWQPRQMDYVTKDGLDVQHQGFDGEVIKQESFSETLF